MIAGWTFRRWMAAAAVLQATAAPVAAHPHVFVDGGVDFVLRDGRVLDALRVTWLYDEFETLYILSANALGLNAQGSLAEADRRTLVAALSDWPEDFDGSAHLRVAGKDVGLVLPPDELDAQMIDGRLQVTFTRRLVDPLEMSGVTAEVGFFESTYFFAFSVTQPARLMGAAPSCETRIVPHDPATEDSELRATLAALGREETPGLANVGRLFADRIFLTCG